VALGIGSLLKMASGGGMGPDEFAAVLSVAGMNVSFTPVAVDRAAFAALASSASLPSAKMVRIQGRMKGGDILDALLVVSSPESVSVVTSKSK
jgi:hypothetical protein